MHVHRVQIYYEDTDHSGAVYHANYLKYFERAREHLLGTTELVRLWEEDGIGFVVYKIAVKYREAARFGDTLEIRTTVSAESEYRAIFKQDVWRPEGATALVEGEVQLCCIDRGNQLVPLPSSVLTRLRGR